MTAGLDSEIGAAATGRGPTSSHAIIAGRRADRARRTGDRGPSTNAEPLGAPGHTGVPGRSRSASRSGEAVSMVRGSSSAMTSGPLPSLVGARGAARRGHRCRRAPERGPTIDPPKGPSTAGAREATIRPCRSRLAPPPPRAPVARDPAWPPLRVSPSPGVAWLAIAGASAWLVFATPMLARLVALQSTGAAGPIVGAVVWGIALTAPACCAILGMARLRRGGPVVRSGRRAPTPVAAAGGPAPARLLVIPRIQLPDGRRIPDVVVGPHGVAFFEPLPPPAAVRRTGERWEVRFSDRRWRPIENPLQRASARRRSPAPPPRGPGARLRGPGHGGRARRRARRLTHRGLCRRGARRRTGMDRRPTRPARPDARPPRPRCEALLGSLA